MNTVVMDGTVIQWICNVFAPYFVWPNKKHFTAKNVAYVFRAHVIIFKDVTFKISKMLG